METTPTEPPILAVLGQYGLAMFQVQAFEGSLAALVSVAEANPTKRETLDRALQRSLKTTTHLFQRASAAELHRRLVGKLDDDLLADVRALIDWRDFLAHRYLRTRLLGAQYELRVDAAANLITELTELGTAFHKTMARVLEASNAIVESWPPKSLPPEEVQAVMLAASRSVLLAEPPPFTRPRGPRP
jgi:hypothetical protein